jgi:dihydroxynaphthoic acid synthetase
MEPDVRYEVKDGVARLTLNRPEVLNALRGKTFVELAEGIRRAEADHSVGVLVIAGAGRSFCAGGDVHEMRDLNPQTGRKFLQMFADAIVAMRRCSKPVISRVQGYCIAGGNEVNLSCDMTIAAEDAHFGQAGAKVASAPVLGGTQFIPRLSGHKKACEVMFLCRLYTAKEAMEMGWVNAVVPAEKLDTTVDAWCAELLEKSPASIRILKQAMYDDSSLERALDAGMSLLAPTYGSDELREGMSAFLEKRKPHFERFR